MRNLIIGATMLGPVLIAHLLAAPAAWAHDIRYGTELWVKEEQGLFKGKIRATYEAKCIPERRVRIYDESDRIVGRTRTDNKGRWQIFHRGTGQFRIYVLPKRLLSNDSHRHRCLGETKFLYANNKKCFGRWPTITRPNEDGVYRGTGGRDVIRGSIGDNVIRGRGGGDFICAGEGDDVIHGNGGADAIKGASGTDVIDGGSKGDSLRGGSGSDLISGARGRDVLRGGSHADILDGAKGNDALRGGAGRDLAVVVTGQDVRIDLNREWSRGEGRDTLQSIESARTGGGDDILKGGPGPNVLIGGRGDDQIVGRAHDDVLMGLSGEDVMEGGAGTDVVSYALVTQNQDLDLDDGDGSEIMRSIEGIEGSQGSETITGTTGPDILAGQGGQDIIFPLGGADVIDGGGGYPDTVDYREFDSPVSIDLSNDSGQAGGEITIVHIEVVHGTAFDDSLKGTGHEDDALYGHDGNDRLQGGADSDYLSGGNGDDELWDSRGTLDGGPGQDTVSGTRHASVQGGPGNDRLYGDHWGTTYLPGPGDDVIEGPGEVSYEPVSHAVFVDLSADTAQAEGTDTLIGVTDIIGSNFDDTLLGDDAANKIRGGGGNDRIEGRAGADYLWGQTGDDDIRGDDGDDVLDGSDGQDPLDGGAGTDRCSYGEPMIDCETTYP